MLSVRDVKQLIQNSTLKLCPLNPMPSTVVSKYEDLLPVLTKIVNNSLQSGRFPEIWKEASVFPLLKKPSLVVIFKNFCPVSNLSFVSKLIERATFNQIDGHLVCNNLYPVAQSTYKRNHSTETALLKVMKDILLNMNKQHNTILMYCLISVLLSILLITAFSLTDYRQNLVWMALPLPGFDLICLAVPSECLFGELYLISLTCGMVFLKARVLAHFSLQFMQAHCLMSWRSTSQLSIVTPMTLSYTSRLVPRRTLARLMQLLLLNIAFKTSGSGCLKTSCSWMMPKQNFFWSAPDSNSPKSQVMA